LKNCIMRSSITCTPSQIWLEWSNHGGCDRQGT
jgi:hypothetical protein